MLFDSQIHDIKSWLPWVRIRREQAALRAIVEQRRRMLSPEEVAADSARICEQIEQMSSFRDAQSVLIYYPVHNEVDLRPLLAKYQDQKTFLFPVTHRYSMEVRPYDGEDMMRKGRLGVPERVKKIGVCYAFQLKKHDIPHLFRDHNMNRVVTPQQTIG